MRPACIASLKMRRRKKGQAQGEGEERDEVGEEERGYRSLMLGLKSLHFSKKCIYEYI